MNSGKVFKCAECAADYDADRFGGRFGGTLREREVALYLELLGGVSDLICDAGAGTGKLSIALLEHRKRVVSVDSSREMLRVAGRKARDRGYLPRASVTDIEALCFKDEAFCATISSRVLMHLQDWRRGLSELARVTQGVLVIDFPPRLSFAGLETLLRKLVGGRGYRRGYRVFKVRRVVRVLEAHGFAVTDLRRSFFFPLRMHRWLDSPEMSQRIEDLAAGLGLTQRFGAPVTVKAERGARAKSSFS